MEYMRPGQVDEAKRERAALYVTFGSTEWHGRQNPLGTDTLTTYGVLLRLAREAGGVVFPPVFLGTGGGHGEFPYTYMVEPAACQKLVEDILRKAETDGFTTVILLAGHGPNPSQFMVPAVKAYYERGGRMRVLVFIVTQLREWPQGANHGGMYETSIMLHMHPETVDMSRLAGHDEDRTGLDVPRNWMGPEHREHPCWGIVDLADPRGNSAAEVGRRIIDGYVAVLRRWLDGEPLEPLVRWRWDAGAPKGSVAR
jgi:creatinine amidohydrolase